MLTMNIRHEVHIVNMLSFIHLLIHIFKKAFNTYLLMVILASKTLIGVDR